MKLRSIFFLSILLLWSLGLPETALSKSYTIPVIRVEVHVQADGTVRITEYRTYELDGSFKWADYRLPFKGFTSIRDINVSENGRAFINRNNEEPGTFLVNREDNFIQIKWFYEAQDERRTFAISYTLEGAVVIGKEWSEFFWNYLSSDREKDTDTLNVDLSLPKEVGVDAIHTWKREPRTNIRLINNADGYHLIATNVDDDDYVKIRAVFPRSVFNEHTVAIYDADYELAQAQKEEETYQKEWAAQQKIDARYAGYGIKLMVVVSILSMLAFIFLYQKYGKRFAVQGISTDETIIIPGSLKPAVAAWLLHARNISSLSLMATLLDLARRRYFTIKEQEPEKKWMGKDKQIFHIEKKSTPPSDTLTEWEASLVTFVNEQIDEGNSRIDKLFSESSYKASKWFNKWKKKLKATCKTKEWYDTKSYKGVYANMGAQFFLGILGAIATYWAGAIGAISLAITFVLLICSFAIIRRTQEGETTYAQWKAYKQGLKHVDKYTFKKDVLDKHFIYAVAFGLSKKQMQALFEPFGDADFVFLWFVFYPGSSHSPADIATTFSSLSATGAAAFPGATGGAGASAGVAGGGAAGGAG